MKRSRPESEGDGEERGDMYREYNRHFVSSPKTREQKYGPPVGSDDDVEKKCEKMELPNFGLSGALASDEVTGMVVLFLFIVKGKKPVLDE